MKGSSGKEKIASKLKKDELKTKKKVKNFAFAPLEELEKTLNILNTEDVTRTKRNMCRDNRKMITDTAHLSNLHYCSLIKHAIMKHNWKDVLKLLLAYIEEPRSDKHTSGIIFKFTLIHLLNDPVARNLNIMDEFLQLALSCQTQTQKTEFMTSLMRISNKNSIL